VEALIAAYAPVVTYLAHRLAGRLPASIGVDDLISAGVLGLLDAIEHYDPARQNLFKIYAACRIRGAMLEYVRAGDGVPRSVREKEHALTQAYAAIERQQGRPATDEEVTTWLGLDLATFDHWLTDVRGVSVVSLDKPLAPEAEGSPVTALAPLTQDAPGPAACAEREALKAHLAVAIDALPQQEKVVLSLYYCEELTMREIGQVLELTESRIAQIHTTAMLHLRATLQNLTHDADAPAASPRPGCPSAVVASRWPSSIHPVSCNPSLALVPACLPEGEPYGHALRD
jgi:RNA polymerase sigma factor for flagellar operon FliA